MSPRMVKLGKESLGSSGGEVTLKQALGAVDTPVNLLASVSCQDWSTGVSEPDVR